MNVPFDNAEPRASAWLPEQIAAYVRQRMDEKIADWTGGQDFDSYMDGLVAREAARRQAALTPPPGTSREAVYDALVAPRLTEIITICQTVGIPIFACFQLTTAAEALAAHDPQGPLYCTTLTRAEGMDNARWDRLYYALGPMK